MKKVNEELMSDLLKITGWNEDKINEEFSKLKCNLHDAKNVFMAIGRLPKEEEQTFINYFGFDSWVRINQQLYK